MTSRRLLGRVGDDGLEVGVRHAPAVEGPGALAIPPYILPTYPMPRRAQAEVEGGGLGWGGWGGSAEAMAPAFWASLGVMPSLRAASALGCQKIEILHGLPWPK